MSSRSLNDILIRSPIELFELVFVAFNLSFISPRVVCFVREGTMYEISTACFIYRSIFVVQALRKRRVHVHCAAYHFRIIFMYTSFNMKFSYYVLS